jgi:tetratricopeptide (TPR) repeat protein
MRKLNVKDVFIASPSGLEREREVVNEVIRKFQEFTRLSSSEIYVAQEWTSVPPGAGRPQDHINELLDASHLAIFIFSDRWGTHPGGETKYSSGTMEEFDRTLGLLGNASCEMRDVCVLFKSQGSNRIADQTDDLSKILAFKLALEESQQIFYGVYESEEHLEGKVFDFLSKWQGIDEPKVPKSIALTETLQKIIDTNQIIPKLAIALGMVADQQWVQAEILFARLTEAGDNEAAIEYAKMMRRQGRLVDARALNQLVAGRLSHDGRIHSTKRKLLVDALSNIGLIERALGNLDASARNLKEAITVAKAIEPMPFELLAYALDNLGLTQLKERRPTEAIAAFTRAQELRSSLPNQREGQFHSNLGRAFLQNSRLGDAAAAFEKAIDLSTAEAGSRAHANSLAGLGEVRIIQGDYHAAIDLLEQALQMNIDSNEQDNVSIVSGLLVKPYIEVGRILDAEGAAARVSQLSSLSTNAAGQVTSLWVRGQIHKAKLQDEMAKEAFCGAYDLAVKKGFLILAEQINHDAVALGLIGTTL